VTAHWVKTGSAAAVSGAAATTATFFGFALGLADFGERETLRGFFGFDAPSALAASAGEDESAKAGATWRSESASTRSERATGFFIVTRHRNRRSNVKIRADRNDCDRRERRVTRASSRATRSVFDPGGITRQRGATR